MKSPNDLNNENRNSTIHELENEIKIAMQDGANSMTTGSHFVNNPRIIKALEDSGYKVIQNINEIIIFWEIT